MSVWISSAAARQRAAASSSPRRRASRAPRSAATQQKSLEDVKCFGSPRAPPHPPALPDPAVRLAPVRERRVDLTRQQDPEAVVEAVAGPDVKADGVEQHPP